MKCEVFVVPGAFHGFDALFRWTAVSRAFWNEQARVLRAALFGQGEVGAATSG